MRIAYITLHWPRTLTSSIGKKIINQIKEWEALGHSVQFFSHRHEVDNETELVNGKNFIYSTKKNIFVRELERIQAVKELVRSVSVYKPDVIYLRWGMYVHLAQRLINIAPSAIEINTNDFEEHKLLGLPLDLYNRATRANLLKNASGLVFTSNELSRDPVFTKFDKPFAVISNGIDLKSSPFYPAPKNSNPHLIFIGTPGMAWHGTEKLVQFADQFPDIFIDVIGIGGINESKGIPSNMKLYGYLQGKAYEEVLSNADAAIGTISLHMKGMKEASPFKIRDCAGRGIPCILPYIDTDLSGLDCEEILQIPNSPDNLNTNGQAIHDFIFSMRGKRLDRVLVRNRIDIGQKEKNRAAFFERVMSESKH